MQALHFQRLANSWNLTVNGRWTKHKSGGNVCPWANSLQCQTQVLLYISSVQFSRLVVSDSLRPHGLQHTRPPCPSPTPRVYPNSCPLSRWCNHRLTLTLTQPSHPLSSPSSPTFNLSQHQGLFNWVSSSHQMVRVLEFQLQHQSYICLCNQYDVGHQMINQSYSKLLLQRKKKGRTDLQVWNFVWLKTRQEFFPRREF